MRCAGALRSSENAVSDHPVSVDPTVIDLVDQLEELVTTGRRVPFTAGVVVNEDEVLELIDRTRLGLPDELTQARHLLEDQRHVLIEAEQEAERILTRAEAEAARLIDEAHARVSVMVGDHEIAEQARLHAATLLAEAEERAAKTCAEADAYAREVMVRLEDQLMRAATTVRKGIEALPVEPGSRRKRRERE
jgi:vacuolar-type H+-ATPase subunit H